MPPGNTSAPSPARGRSALLVTTAAYADASLAWLRPPVSGAGDLAAALAGPRSGFAVSVLADGIESEVRLAITDFLSGRTADETVLLYVACHVIADQARSYFAAVNTWLRNPQATAVPVAAVVAELDKCGAGNRTLILDCCFSGGSGAQMDGFDVAAEFGLGGRGIALLSGSGAREYSTAGRPLGPELRRSAFTAGLAEGLATGAADADRDGIITVADAYDYARRFVLERGPGQAPQSCLDGVTGDIVLSGTRAASRDARGPQVARRIRDTRDTRGGQLPGPPGSPSGSPSGGGPASRGHAVTAAEVAGTRGAGPAILDQDKDNAYCVAFSPDARVLASGAWGRPVRLRDVTTGRLVRELRSAGHSAYHLAFSPDGESLATGGRDGAVTLSEVRTGKKVRTRKPEGGAVRAVAFSPDSTLLASGHQDGVIRLWDVPYFGKPRELSANGETIFGVTFSPNGGLLAAACSDGAIRVWHVADGTFVAALRWHSGWATGVAFSRRGTVVASAGADGIVALHDAVSGELFATLRAEEGIVNAIAVTADGRMLAAAYETGAVAVWEIATGEYEMLRGHGGFVNDVAFSPDGRMLASAGKDGTVQLWR